MSNRSIILSHNKTKVEVALVQILAHLNIPNEYSGPSPETFATPLVQRKTDVKWHRGLRLLDKNNISTGNDFSETK